jgi:hypothetical protein
MSSSVLCTTSLQVRTIQTAIHSICPLCVDQLILSPSSSSVLETDDQNSPDWIEHSEADTFFCFSLMMSEIRVTDSSPPLLDPSPSSPPQDMYIHNMDEASTGISGRIQKFVDTLRWYDEDLCNHLIQQVSLPLPPLSLALSLPSLFLSSLL